MGQSLDTHFMDSSGEIGKLKAEIGELKYRMQESTITLKNSEQKYKPVITPPRRRGGNFPWWRIIWKQRPGCTECKGQLEKLK